MKLRNKKTGEIYDKVNIHVSPWKIGTRGWTSFDYNSVDKFNEEWEDYAPKEPLIEDEEIRRVVKCLGFEKIAFVQLGATWRAYDAELAGGFELIIKSKPFDACEDGKAYSIDELCGEEEAPEPLEPRFIDLDERIREKEEE